MRSTGKRVLAIFLSLVMIAYAPPALKLLTPTPAYAWTGCDCWAEYNAWVAAGVALANAEAAVMAAEKDLLDKIHAQEAAFLAWKDALDQLEIDEAHWKAEVTLLCLKMSAAATCGMAALVAWQALLLEGGKTCATAAACEASALATELAVQKFLTKIAGLGTAVAAIFLGPIGDFMAAQKQYHKSVSLVEQKNKEYDAAVEATEAAEETLEDKKRLRDEKQTAYDEAMQALNACQETCPEW